MEGGTYTPADWQNLLIDIRWKAHAAGLRPDLGHVEYIVATVSEVREGSPSCAWADEPDNWSKVILTACGEAGWIQLHDLLDGFADTAIPSDRHKRLSAIEWAESWMNARERQLSQSASVSIPTEVIERLERLASLMPSDAERLRGPDSMDESLQKADPKDDRIEDLRDTRWFARATDGGVDRDVLRKMREAGRITLARQTTTGRWMYSASEIAKCKPEYRRAIEDAVSEGADFRKRRKKEKN
jgi:hypothetical protein